MSQQKTQVDLHSLESMLSEATRWASLDVTIQDISNQNRALVKDLSKYEWNQTIRLLASLLTIPEYQSNCIRLEILVTLAVAHCQGEKQPSIDKVVHWFSEIGKTQCVAGEDPAEGVFVTLVHFDNTDYRILEGTWESAGFYTQRILDVISSTPKTGAFGKLRKSVNALLSVSDIVCENAGLHRYQLGFDQPRDFLSPNELPQYERLVEHVCIAPSALRERGIRRSDICPFVFHQSNSQALLAQQVGRSELERCPLIEHRDGSVSAALPTALSVAFRDYVIASMIRIGATDKCDEVLRRSYAVLIRDTPLLGGASEAPVRWRKAEDHSFCSFSCPVDEGYVIAYQLFLPSIRIHAEGGLKYVYEDQSVLTQRLQESIDSAVRYYEREESFREGVVVLVGCGWGKAFATRAIELDHPRWRLQLLSVANLVRLSWDAEISPIYFWRLLDGLEAAQKAGVHFVDPNGLLNAIGWVRYNRGHFVPHDELPEGRVSLHEPLLINPPTNLLREVRANIDGSYDRHHAVDNAGRVHQVQRVSCNPLFVSESQRRMYVSLNDLRAKRLTAVYEGEHRLWITVLAPNFSEKHIEYRLWEMVVEWLHRLGNVLDRMHSSVVPSEPVKVYVRFKDSMPDADVTPNEVILDVGRVCHIEESQERRACNVIFKEGYIDAFRKPENVGERWLVRTLARAFLRLLGMESHDERVAEVEADVVPSEKARFFHLFQARDFLQHVRSSLPKEPIAIDDIDQAAERVNLAWRTNARYSNDRLEGREVCTSFLNGVVDGLLREIGENLSSYDRLSTVVRLVANAEAARAEENHWRATSAALLGLHGNEPGPMSTYVEQLSKFAGAGITSRILCEMALCECPLDSGKRLADIEFSKLVAKAALVMHFGGVSDAIHYHALPPELQVSVNGGVIMRQSVGVKMHHEPRG